MSISPGRIQFLISFIILLVFNSCNQSDPEPDEKTILIVHLDSFDPSIEKWFFITNGSGEIIDYKKITESGQTVFTKTSDLVNSKINVYSMTLFTGLTGIRNCFINAYLNINPGQQWYYDAPDAPDESVDLTLASHHLNAMVVDAPKNALIQLSTGSDPVLTTTDLGSTDGFIDTTKIQMPPGVVNSNRTLNVYSQQNPMYASVKYTANNDSILMYHYPKDFVPFDHTFSVPTGTKPKFVVVSGFRDEKRNDFVYLSDTRPGLMETIDASTEIKLCYRDGFDYYKTRYDLGNRMYSKVGGIPAKEDVIIPSQNITVSDYDLWNFKATHSSAIDYRISIYSLRKTVNNIEKYYTISVSSPVDKGAFDLSLPQAFKNIHPDIEFSSLEYNFTFFMDSKGPATYDEFVNTQLKIPGSYKTPMEMYGYVISK